MCYTCCTATNAKKTKAKCYLPLQGQGYLITVEANVHRIWLNVWPDNSQVLALDYELQQNQHHWSILFSHELFLSLHLRSPFQYQLVDLCNVPVLKGRQCWSGCPGLTLARGPSSALAADTAAGFAEGCLHGPCSVPVLLGPWDPPACQMQTVLSFPPLFSLLW